MSYILAISHDALIEALEYMLGNVYENIKDGDKIEDVRVGYAQIFITIGEEE